MIFLMRNHHLHNNWCQILGWFPLITLLFPLDNSVSTDVSFSVNIDLPTSYTHFQYHQLWEHLYQDYKKQWEHLLHEVVGDNHSTLSTPATSSPYPMLPMGSSTSRFKHVQNIIPISTSGSYDTSLSPDFFISAEISTTNSEQSNYAQSPIPLT